MKRTSPWRLGPFCATPRARERWDWSGTKEKRAEINAARKAKGLPPIKARPQR